MFFNTLGESYIATALKTAKAADPNAKVYINDFNIEGTGIRSLTLLSNVLTLPVPFGLQVRRRQR